ncbi:alpha/beta fold hydrolase [Mycobacterium sp. 050128]|uniref:alpha/beta fold hydrolase n=1 Tax=Mycobacterium sp. 050128 TaxID=3096112 RepID=UPI002EDBB746
MSEHSPISGKDVTNNYLISLRNDVGGGKPGTDIGDTKYIDLAPDKSAYNLKNDAIHPDQWLHRLRATNENVLVFVHGFDVDADTALERHKSIKDYLPSDVSLVSFDWPAANSKVIPKEKYMTDRAKATQIASPSRPRLLDECLQLLLYHFDAKNIHLFAHSMGAYVTQATFQAASAVRIGRVLMAAADDDQRNYLDGSQTLRNFLSKCDDLTAYWSTFDQALPFSAEWNTYIPLGLIGYPDADTPTKHNLQCSHYYYVYAKPDRPSDIPESEWSHVWYILFQPTNPPPLENDFYIDLGEVLHRTLTEPTRALRPTLRSISADTEEK